MVLTLRAIIVRVLRLAVHFFYFFIFIFQFIVNNSQMLNGGLGGRRRSETRRASSRMKFNRVSVLGESRINLRLFIDHARAIIFRPGIELSSEKKNLLRIENVIEIFD